MPLLFAIAFVSGLVTILAPCIWPLLPIILSTSVGASKLKSFGITLGILLSFGAFTLSVSYLVSALKFDPEVLRYFAVVVIGFLGVMLALPPLSRFLEAQVSKLSGIFAQTTTSQKRSGFVGGLIIGLALGLVWTPCAGPILATIATLAATQAVNFGILAITFFYLLGVGIPLFIFSVSSSTIFSKTQILNKFTGRIQQIFGVVMILTAVAIYTGYDRTLQAKLLDYFPSYSNFLNKLENTGGVQQQLEQLKDGDDSQSKSNLKILGDAPDFVGVNNWLNSEELSISDLKGKVVLVDFWTYTCINCIRTLPYVTGWYERYKNSNFVVVGVHTPEFEFEKKKENVEDAIKQYKINYPVAQDNDFATWRNYNNRYWPAKYLIDASGKVRYTHFGEGKYKETEENIQTLIREAGQSVSVSVGSDEEARGWSVGKRPTPETYLGSARADRFVSGRLENGHGSFQLVGSPRDDGFSLGGNWTVSDEFIESSPGSKLVLNFNAKMVHLVITPRNIGDRVRVSLDGEFNKEIVLDNERLYDLISLDSISRHNLELEFLDSGVRIFAFTFGY